MKKMKKMKEMGKKTAGKSLITFSGHYIGVLIV